MKKLFYLLLFISSSAYSQDNTELAKQKVREAVQLMDAGKYKESIVILEDCIKLDPDNYMYAYEIAYAQVLQKEYEKALKTLTKAKKYKVSSSQVYQMSGNCYSYMGKPDKAIKEYEEGMKRFPNAGNLHLEKGNIYLQKNEYNDAVENYRKGVEVDPMFSSNYFRLAKLYLGSKDKLAGIIYGELFINIERSTKRTEEMSDLLFKAYQSAITLGKNEMKISFCQTVIDASTLVDGEKFKLPLCAAFEKNFIMAILGHQEFNLESLTKMRTTFIRNFFQEDYIIYPNVLFAYQKEMFDKGFFEAYNYYVFQIGAETEFKTWFDSNQDKYKAFLEWYRPKENAIKITKLNMYLN